MVKSLQATNLRAGKATYFFDIQKSKNDRKYLRITESRFVEEGKDHVRNSVVIWPESVSEFQKNLKDMAAYLA